MALPVLVIVGRPNVGKSTLFNALVGARVAIVDPTAGVTRDRVSVPIEIAGRWVELVDTGGIGIVEPYDLAREIQRQVEIAIEEADLVLFLIDAREGVLPADEEIAQRLRRLDCKVIAVANKADSDRVAMQASAGYSLGFGDVWAISAKTGLGVSELRDHIDSLLPAAEERPPELGIRLAIVGRMNSGKSTLVNALVGKERVIVSDRPGTTRDAIDVPFEWKGRRIVAVDTAGIRKLRSVSGTPDFYAQGRAERAIKRADIVLFLIDATRSIGRVDRRIAESIAEAGRPCVIVVAKWDLTENVRVEAYREYVDKLLPPLTFAPMSVISAHTRLNLDGTLELVCELYEQAGRRATTGELNRALERALTVNAPETRPGRGGRLPKIYYATQADVRPPTIIVFVNDPDLFTVRYRRYLANRFREIGHFPDIPVRVFFKAAR
ncbi:MAG: ribosome biogenesis GTPase Der [Planctomycetota bacterium]